jgi:hypothetical protein
MRVSELIDILKDHPPDAEVELAVVSPVGESDDDITVDRYPIDGVMPWDEETEDGPESTIWLVGGEPDDVEDFLDALEIESTSTTENNPD